MSGSHASQDVYPGRKSAEGKPKFGFGRQYTLSDFPTPRVVHLKSCVGRVLPEFHGGEILCRVRPYFKCSGWADVFYIDDVDTGVKGQKRFAGRVKLFRSITER